MCEAYYEVKDADILVLIGGCEANLMNFHTMCCLVQWHQQFYKVPCIFLKEIVNMKMCIIWYIKLCKILSQIVAYPCEAKLTICQKSTKNCTMRIGEANCELYYFENNIETLKPLQCGLSYNYTLCAKFILKIYLQPIFRATLHYWRYIKTNYI